MDLFPQVHCTPSILSFFHALMGVFKNKGFRKDAYSVMHELVFRFNLIPQVPGLSIFFFLLLLFVSASVIPLELTIIADEALLGGAEMVHPATLSQGQQHTVLVTYIVWWLARSPLSELNFSWAVETSFLIWPSPLDMQPSPGFSDLGHFHVFGLQQVVKPVLLIHVVDRCQVNIVCLAVAQCLQPVLPLGHKVILLGDMARRETWIDGQNQRDDHCGSRMRRLMLVVISPAKLELCVCF